MEESERRALAENFSKEGYAVLPTSEFNVESTTEASASVNSLQSATNAVSRARTTVQRQRAGASVEERPLMLHADFSLPDTARTDKGEKEIDGFLQNLNIRNSDLYRKDGSSTNMLAAARNDRDQNNEVSLFSAGFLAWKSSAAFVVESLRERFNSFRRARSLDNEVQIEKANAANTTLPTSKKLLNRNKTNNYLERKDSTHVNVAEKLVADSNKHPEQIPLNSIRSGQLATKHHKNVIDKFFDRSPDDGTATSAEELSAVQPSTESLRSPKVNEGAVTSNTCVAADPACNSGALCAPCIGSSKCAYANSTSVIGTLEECSNKDYDEARPVALTDKMKIVHQQPANTGSYEQMNDGEHQWANIVKEQCENQNDISLDENDCQRQNVPIVMLHSASPASFKNTVSVISCAPTYLSLKTNSDESTETLVKFPSTDSQDTFPHTSADENLLHDESLDLLELSDAEEKNTSDSNPEKYSVSLWDLRNSLEQSTIEVKCPGTNFGDFDEDKRCRSISITTTDGMTEASPVSTPSSERMMSHGKSISDSDDDNRAFFVTASGRLSPRQPGFCRRNSSGLSSSPEQSGEKKQRNCECAIDPAEMPHLCGSNSKNTTLPPKGSVITTKAMVERLPSGANLEALKKNEPSPNKFTCYQKRRNYTTSKNWCTIDSCDGDLQESDAIKLSPFRKCENPPTALSRQLSLPLSFQHRTREPNRLCDRNDSNSSSAIVSFVAEEDIETTYDKHSDSLHCVKAFSNDCGTCVYGFDRKRPTTDRLNQQRNYAKQHTRARSKRQEFLAADSTSSDDVFFDDSTSAKIVPNASRTPVNNPQTYQLAKEATIKQKHYRSASLQYPSASRCASSTIASYRSAIFPLFNSDMTPVPPPRLNQRLKFQTRPASANSSGASSPLSPTGVSPTGQCLNRTNSVELESDDSISSQASSSRSSSSIKNFSRLFRRSAKHTRQRCDSAPTFCGYTMGRDYCVDSETDRIFKEFLCEENPSSSATSSPSGEQLPPPSHMLPPPPLNRGSATQLRRQVMRKQYSDSIAMYYGQRQRRWRFTKQKSDSVNCPVDRGVFRRQDRIEEEFDPEEINERLLSSSSRRESERPDYVPPTVTELKEWRRSSEDRTPVLRQTNSLPLESSEPQFDLAAPHRSARRVTFVRGHFDKERTQTAVKSQSLDNKT